MHDAALSLISGVFAALPFLPRGKGALILILGGMLFLTFSLLWSFVAPRRSARPTSHPNPPMARPPGLVLGASYPQAAPDRKRLFLDAQAYWIRAIMATAARAGLGRPELVQSEPLRHVIRLSGCRSCREHPRGSGCDAERRTLEQVLRAFAPKGRVVELSCNTGTPASCSFELRPGAAAK